MELKSSVSVLLYYRILLIRDEGQVQSVSAVNEGLNGDC